MKQKILLALFLLTGGMLHGIYAQEPYAVLSEDTTTLTFYYDNNKANRKGMDVGPFTSGIIDGEWEINSGWYKNRATITTVVFDNSFADCMELTSTAWWFRGCSSLSTINGIENLKTDNVTDMSNMFFDCSKLTSLDVSHFNTSNVTTMMDMFKNCSSLTSLDVSNFNTSNVTSMSWMFSGCSGLTSLDISNFNTSNVTDMIGMFSGCSGLTTLDVSHFNTSNVTIMSEMFSGCRGLTTLDVSHFNTSNVTIMSEMFSGCSGLTFLDVSNFNTANVTIMNGMFSGCSGLTYLDVSNFNTANVTDMLLMFSRCANLKELDLSNFDMRKIQNIGGMFQECENLESIKFGENFSFDSADDKAYLGLSKCYLKSISIGRDVPYIANPKFFLGAGTKMSPIALHVPEQYIDNYQSHFKDGMFYGGYFTLNEDSSSSPDEPWTPVFCNKKLLSITEESGSTVKYATIEYDNQNRVVKYTIKGGNRTEECTYSYPDENHIVINDGEEVFNYTLKDGKIKTAGLFFDGFTNSTLTYAGNKFVLVGDNGNTGEMTWDGDVFKEWNLYHNDKVEEKSLFTFNSISTDPIVHALFGFFTTYAAGVDDFLEPLALYPYYGELPKGLVETNIHTEYESSTTRTNTYHYTYEKNAIGDIIKVTKSNDYKTVVYTLEWDGVPIEPDTPPTTELVEADSGKQDFSIGGTIDSNTNLNGVVIGNVYYNIASGSGSYNAADGCIEITKPTADDDIEGKDIFGEDFKNHFTGIVFKVAAGKGTIKVNAQTTGNMMIKVKVGSNEPYEMMLSGKVEAKFPYNVTEPTYVFIYGSSFTGLASNRAATAGGDVLRIYGLSWDDTTGIEELNNDVNNDAPIYNLRGQRLAAPQKGINIIGGKKVVVK